MRAVDLIAKKRDGGEHSREEIQDLIRAVVDGAMPDYQAAAWLMAAFLNGLTPAETLHLTLAMRDSGSVVRWEGVQGIKLDKHSSGGVGDKTSLVVVPILAAAGIPMLKMSGRGLGFTGGTIDKLQSIPGLRTDLSVADASSQVARIGAAMIGQSAELVPADRKLYALRDVTATVESIPLIAASIMSKKLAGGADAVLLDVKVGQGAFMKSLDRARKLARTMVEIGSGAGVRTEAMLTAMDEPLGRAVGTACEVAEAIDLLADPDRSDPRFRELCIALASHGIVVAGKAKSGSEAGTVVDGILSRGDALAKFAEIIEAQGGDPAIVHNPDRLPQAGMRVEVTAESRGYVTAIDAEAVGLIAMRLGAGRAAREDAIDPAVGILLQTKTGKRVERGDPLAVLLLGQDSNSEAAARDLRAAYSLGSSAIDPGPVILATIP